ncbi:hypothetical protein Y032_0054g2458 [Ancylostoma ceylanicum]|uniref:Uncharacterized protein n=1 Tax=Ancylostoma ceylanicum TaxID=53326 RepID=A0A016U6R8_9BILA|nr:hypothetical protein Y032_0054g2458 [Ancylostoma ceylanicum]
MQKIFESSQTLHFKFPVFRMIFQQDHKQNGLKHLLFNVETIQCCSGLMASVSEKCKQALFGVFSLLFLGFLLDDQIHIANSKQYPRQYP